MGTFIGVVIVALGIAMLTGGIAAIRTGWLFPFQYRWVRRPAVQGWAQVLMGTAFLVQGGTLLLAGEDVRQAGSLVGMGVLIAGLALSTVAQMWKRTP
ncbi:hypothetical protein [Streptomyces sp. NPDC048659]|uniref:hypothetical protein n=1 Tax=Streptomyces sp. NPDC048659 TaxID=3155489 RepID=UPI0034419616